MFNRFLSHIESKNLIPKDHTVLLACSGGMDSSVLFHLLLKAGIEFSVAHVDHLTREGDSTADAAFVEKLCADFEIDYHLHSLEYLEDEDGNFQSYAHDQRYNFFQSLSYDIILTAHHQDDIVESILLNFIQGRSLGGIYEKLGNVIRPLLPFSRSEISDYAFENDIPFVEDYSNLDSSYDRNFIRNEILPLLKSRFNNLNNRIIGLSDSYAENQRLLNELLTVSKDDSGRYFINKSEVLKSKVPSTLLYTCLQSFGYSKKQCGEIVKAIDSIGARIDSSSYTLTIDRDTLYIDQKRKSPAIIAFDYSEQNHIEFGKHSFEIKKVDKADHLTESNYAYFPIDKLNSNLTIRHWQPGDSFKPFGMNGHTQSLKKFFTEQKIDVQLKQETPLIINGNDIIWVVPYRTHDDYRIDPEEGSFLEIRCEIKSD